MKPKLKYDSKNVRGIITCETSSAANIENLLERFGYNNYKTIVENKQSTIVIVVRDKADFKRLNSFWKSGKQFI